MFKTLVADLGMQMRDGGVDPLWYQAVVLCKGFGGRREAGRGQGCT